MLFLNKGNKIYDGDFNTLIRGINPKRKLVYEFPNNPDSNLLNNLYSNYQFIINDKVLTAELSENNLQSLVSELIKIESPQNLIFEDLPVDEAMRSFFENPDKYINDFNSK